jgi:hypothetical protein
LKLHKKKRQRDTQQQAAPCRWTSPKRRIHIVVMERESQSHTFFLLLILSLSYSLQFQVSIQSGGQYNAVVSPSPPPAALRSDERIHFFQLIWKETRLIHDLWMKVECWCLTAPAAAATYNLRVTKWNCYLLALLLDYYI